MGKKHGKRYRAWAEKVPAGPVSVAEAVKVVQSFESDKTNPKIELAMHLGIDPAQADQALRGSISLPNGIGVSRKVIAFCEGEDQAKAIEAGASEAGSDDLIKKVQDGWMDFDIALATPAMMKKVSRLGRVLGPQGKMPSPKAGTVVDDIVLGVAEFSAGKVEYRNDDGGNLHLLVGRADFETDKLVENIEAFLAHIRKIRPSSVKGTYIKGIRLSATMSPSVAIVAG